MKANIIKIIVSESNQVDGTIKKTIMNYLDRGEVSIEHLRTVALQEYLATCHRIMEFHANEKTNEYFTRVEALEYRSNWLVDTLTKYSDEDVVQLVENSTTHTTLYEVNLSR
jgi:hypothetical protein